MRLPRGRLVVAASLAAVVALAAVLVSHAVRSAPIPSRPKTWVMAYVVQSDGMKGWSPGLQRYLHSGVYIQDLAGGPARPVLPVGLTAPIDPSSAALSPDGTKVAVLGFLVDARNHQTMGNFAIWVVGLDGTGGHVVASFPGTEAGDSPSIDDMTWTTDSAHIVFGVSTSADEFKTEAFRLWRADAQGPLNMAPIDGTDGFDMPTVNPKTGELLAVKMVSTDSGREGQGLYLWRRGSAQPVELLGTGGASQAVFSPDGSQLAYLLPSSSDGEPATDLVVTREDGALVSRATLLDGVQDLAFGPGGTLYYDHIDSDLGTESIYSTYADGAEEPGPVRTAGVGVASPSVALVPDSQQIRPPTPPVVAPPSAANDFATGLHTVDFRNVAAPGAACFTRGTIQLYDGDAYTPSASGNPGNPITFDPTDRPYAGLYQEGRPVYGELAPGQQVAVVGFECDNNGGTADGQMLFSDAVYTWTGGRLRLVGLLTPQTQPRDQHVTILGDARVQLGTITVDEIWYRPDDATCCPTGRAQTTWVYRGGRIVPHDTRVEPPART